MEDERRPVLERADGRAMTYRRFGQGPPLVCLAGGPGADARYLETLGGLDHDFELIVPDMRGTGDSPPPAHPSGYAFTELAQDVERLRAHLGLETMTLLAHSAGCTTALIYAAAHPDRLDKLILVTPSRILHDDVEDDIWTILTRRGNKPWFAAVREARERLAAGPDPDDVPGLVTATAPASYARWTEREQAHAVAMQPTDWDATRWFWKADVDGAHLRVRLGEVRVPVLVVTGNLDAATGVNAGAAWAACFPDGRHVSLAGSGHVPWVDVPDEFTALIRRELRP